MSLSNQEIYDRVKAHLLAQRKRAMEYGICKYRTEDGLKCAVGCLIPDEHYNPSFEGVSPNTDARVGGLLERKVVALTKALEASGIYKSSYLLLCQLQEVHDDGPADAWHKKLADLALDWGLKP